MDPPTNKRPVPKTKHRNAVLISGGGTAMQSCRPQIYLAAPKERRPERTTSAPELVNRDHRQASTPASGFGSLRHCLQQPQQPAPYGVTAPTISAAGRTSEIRVTFAPA